MGSGSVSWRGTSAPCPGLHPLNPWPRARIVEHVARCRSLDMVVTDVPAELEREIEAEMQRQRDERPTP